MMMLSSLHKSFGRGRRHLWLLLIYLTRTIIILPSNTFGFSATHPHSTAPTPRRRIKYTKVAVEGKSSASVITPPPGSAALNVTLTHYMRLPVEQYVLIEMPLGSSLTKLHNDKNASDCEHDDSLTTTYEQGEEFELVVPEITFFNLTLQPVVICSVQPMEDNVVIFSEDCYLRGSPFIEKTRLNERFDFHVRTTLTWHDDPLHISAITASTSIDVNVDVPRPFSSIPKFILERTGNAAMGLSLKYIQANFVRNLANDFEKWVADEKYRSYRASLSSSKEQDLKGVLENEALVGSFI